MCEIKCPRPLNARCYLIDGYFGFMDEPEGYVVRWMKGSRPLAFMTLADYRLALGEGKRPPEEHDYPRKGVTDDRQRTLIFVTEAEATQAANMVIDAIYERGLNLCYLPD